MKKLIAGTFATLAILGAVAPVAQADIGAVAPVAQAGIGVTVIAPSSYGKA